MALEALVTSDWHLCGMYKPLGSAAPKMQFTEIDKIYAHAVENGFKHVFVPGDISDVSRMDEENFMMLVRHLMKWDSLIQTVYMRGNHDVEHKFKTSLDVLEVLCEVGVFKNFKLMTRAETLKIDGVNVSFLPWPANEAPKAKDGRGRLIFAHIETAGAIGDNGRPLKHGNDDQVVRTENDFIVSGHIHQYQELKKKRIVYVGTPYQKNFGESLPKGFIEIKAGYKKGDDKLQFKHTFVNNRPNFVLENFVVKEQGDWDKLKADPNIRYKVYVDRNAGVIVPKNITQLFPNVVHLSGVNTASKSIEEVLEEARSNGSDAQDLPKINPLTGLKKFLRKENVDEKLFKKARQYVREGMQYAAQKSLAVER